MHPCNVSDIHVQSSAGPTTPLTARPWTGPPAPPIRLHQMLWAHKSRVHHPPPRQPPRGPQQTPRAQYPPPGAGLPQDARPGAGMRAAGLAMITVLIVAALGSAASAAPGGRRAGPARRRVGDLARRRSGGPGFGLRTADNGTDYDYDGQATSRLASPTNPVRAHPAAASA